MHAPPAGRASLRFLRLLYAGRECDLDGDTLPQRGVARPAHARATAAAAQQCSAARPQPRWPSARREHRRPPRTALGYERASPGIGEAWARLVIRGLCPATSVRIPFVERGVVDKV